MRQLLHRVQRSKANRMVVSGVLGVAVGVPAAGGSPSPSASPSRFVPQQACEGATATRQYTAEAMTFRLRLDLDGCRWWDGSARNLVIYVGRDDGTGPASRYSTMACESSSDPGAEQTSFCEVFATVQHPAEEKAVTYQGEATWTWQDGERRVSFETHCSTSQGQARCDDPVATWHE